ncbi:S41 family peptidase [Massilia sp. S19_KUP03_FR1]|uniref:S41 family peptidase n=1 Tax=Massilia sp. S19_KUP03_FR1 TaxID=3025503 RepID=UPI002FCD47E7
MKPLSVFAATLLVAGTLLTSAHAAAPPLDTAARGELIAALAKQLDDYYVYPDVARKLGQALRVKLGQGGYDALTEPKAFARTLTDDLRAVSHDKHLRVFAADTPLPPMNPDGKPTPGQESAMHKQMAAAGFGIFKTDILAGNIGYLDLRGFAPVKFAAPAITAAMTQLADTDALIIDLRWNGGGDPACVAWLASYLFDKRTHLNDLAWREGNRTEQFWTEPTVPGKRYGQTKPLYVLTSPRTFSGGEEFSYDMQQLKRATRVGETTGGGANPGQVRPLSPYFGAFIPNGRAINPITQTSWEGTGVVPEIKVAADDALATAQRLATERLKLAPAAL